MMTTSKCAAEHIAKWMIEPRWFASAVAAVKAGTWLVVEARRGDAEIPEPYQIHGNIAVVELLGPMMKVDSKFGGTNTVRVRHAVRELMADQDVKGIILHVDSPGGTASGLAELADEISAAVAQGTKPMWGHVDDIGASAAYWAVSQTSRVFTNRTGEVGSIGTMAILTDTSGMAAMEGVKVHVVSTGKFKGAFAPGTPITSEQLAYAQETVDTHGEFFIQGVAKGRKKPVATVRGWADGRMFFAEDAAKMGMIDGVQSFDTTLGQMQKLLAGRARRARDIRQRI
jgi:signal peptide peptidase SppA